jgi:homoserine O-acetyltransferase
MKTIGTHIYTHNKPFVTENGSEIIELQLAYQTWGTLNAERSNVILVCHALTGHANAKEWFSGLFTQQGILTSNEYFVICINVPGSCYGSTGPSSINPKSGSRYGNSFPELTIRDFVNAQKLVLDELGITEIPLAIGGSMGGMQVLEFVLMDDRVKSAAVLAVGARHEAWAIGISEAQRYAIYADPKWRNGNYEENEQPEQGLAAARMMAMVTYRTQKQYNERFGRSVQEDGRFEVVSYLQYQGEKLAGRFDALSYVRLTQAMDSHDVGRDRGGIENALSKCYKPVLIVGIDSDLLYPTNEQKKLVDQLPNGTYKEIISPYGHDAFLIEFDTLNEILKSFLKAEVIN